MAGGKVETNPAKLADHCDAFASGTKALYEAQGNKADMWFFELYHHLNDCAAALRKSSAAKFDSVVEDNRDRTAALNSW